MLLCLRPRACCPRVRGSDGLAVGGSRPLTTRHLRSPAPARRYTEPPQPPQNCRVASLAPSAIAASFAHVGIDRGLADPGAETAIAAGDDVVAADEVGIAGDALRNQFRVLDKV